MVLLGVCVCDAVGVLICVANVSLDRVLVVGLTTSLSNGLVVVLSASHRSASLCPTVRTQVVPPLLPSVTIVASRRSRRSRSRFREHNVRLGQGRPLMGKCAVPREVQRGAELTGAVNKRTREHDGGEGERVKNMNDTRAEDASESRGTNEQKRA